MNNLFPLLLLLLGCSNIYAQSIDLSTESFQPFVMGESGTATVTGDLDNDINELNFTVDFSDFDLPIAEAYIHMGPPENPRPILYGIRLRADELSTQGQIGRQNIVDQLEKLTKYQAKAQVIRNIEIVQFEQLATAIENDNACIVLQVRGRTGWTSIFAAPLRLAEPEPALVPTFSQWAIFILGMMMSCTALVYVKQNSMTAALG